MNLIRNRNISELKQTNRLIVAAWAVYADATLARLTYSASMVEVISELSVSNGEVGAVLSAYAAISTFFVFVERRKV